MKTFKIVSRHPRQTLQLGEEVARHLKGGDILCFFGDLGSGKTTFIKGIARGLKISPQKVRSPTFILMNAYEGRLPLFHFDLYRLEDVQDIRSIGCDEFLYDDGVSVVEWADRLGGLLPAEYLKVVLEHKSPEERVIRLSAEGRRYQGIIEQLTAAEGGR
jgi:tRNA threonylcarbamoyladenosine biosynthesis protein TsaE